MAPIDLAAVWKPDPSKQSALARWRGIVRIAQRQLRHRFLENLLILLGIALGVGVLTGMGSFLRFLVSLDEDLLRSQPEMQSVIARPRTFDASELWGVGSPPAVRLAAELAEPVQLSTDDLIAARRELADAEHVVAGGIVIRAYAITSVGGRPVQADDQEQGASITEYRLQLQRATPDEMAFRGRPMIAGRSFSWDDYAEGRRALILEEEGVTVLFPGLEPAEVIGQSIGTAGLGAEQGGAWQIVGVVAKQELNPFMAALQPPKRPGEVVGYAPHTAGESQPVPIMQISVTPAPGATPEQLVNEVELFFAQRHGPDRVTVTNPVETLRELNQNRRATVLALMGLAALALVVAAINVLNLFTARVSRRRRLMAMNVALGADRRLLFQLTLLEALLLGVAGSVVGLLPADGVVAVLRALLVAEAALASPGLADLVAGIGIGWPDVLLGLAAGIGTSLLFGLYPAFLSASIDIASGLRGE